MPCLCTLQPHFAGPYSHVSVSPDGKVCNLIYFLFSLDGPAGLVCIAPPQLLALFGVNGNVHVVASDFTQNLSETFTQTSEPPTQLAWYANFAARFLQ